MSFYYQLFVVEDVKFWPCKVDVRGPSVYKGSVGFFDGPNLYIFLDIPPKNGESWSCSLVEVNLKVDCGEIIFSILYGASMAPTPPVEG